MVDKWNQQRSAHAFSSEAAGPAPRAVAPVEVLVEEEPIEAILEDVIDDEAGVLGGDVTAIVDALHRKARGDA